MLHSGRGCFVLNTLSQRQNGRHLPDGIFKCIFLDGNVWSSNNISLQFVPKGPINNIPALVQIMAWRRPGDKPLSEPMMINLLTHICVTRPQWVKGNNSARVDIPADRCHWNEKPANGEVSRVYTIPWSLMGVKWLNYIDIYTHNAVIMVNKR